MNLYRITFTFFCLLTLTSCKKNIPEIFRGELTEDWVYKNQSMNFSLQLPRTWNFVANENSQSSFIPMNDKLTNSFLPNDKIRVTQEFNLSQENSIFPLFSITTNNLNDIKSGNRKEELAFAVVSSKNGNAEDDIQTLKSELRSEFELHTDHSDLNKENLETSDKLQFGANEKIPYVKISTPDMEGNIYFNRIYALKNYDNFDLLVMITYHNDEELQNVKNVLTNIKL